MVALLAIFSPHLSLPSFLLSPRVYTDHSREPFSLVLTSPSFLDLPTIYQMASVGFKTAYLLAALVALPQVLAGPGCARRNYGKPDCVQKCKGGWGYGGSSMGAFACVLPVQAVGELAVFFISRPKQLGTCDQQLRRPRYRPGQYYLCRVRPQWVRSANCWNLSLEST